MTWVLPKNFHLSNFALADSDFPTECHSLSRLCSQSLLVRSKPTRWQTWSRKWKLGLWYQHLCGRILKPSRAKVFAIAYGQSLADIHASLSARPDAAVEQTTRATFGLTSLGQLTLFAPPSFGWKTWKGTFHSDCGTCLPIWLCSDTEWKTAVESQRGDYSRRLSEAQAINASGSSSSQWMTATVSCGGHTQKDGSTTPKLDQQVKLWPTPKTLSGGANSKRKSADPEGRTCRSWRKHGQRHPLGCGKVGGRQSRDGTENLDST